MEIFVDKVYLDIYVNSNVNKGAVINYSVTFSLKLNWIWIFEVEKFTVTLCFFSIKFGLPLHTDGEKE